MKRRYWSYLSKDLQFAQLPPQGMQPDRNGISLQNLERRIYYTLNPLASCTIIGYGATRHAGPSQKQLFEAEVRVIDNRKCRDIIGHIWAPQNGANTVCALGNNQDSCQGDSG